MELKLRPREECTFDAVSMGEVMLRLDPGEGRIRTARSFRAWEGGGEYTVIRGLHKCFGLNTAVITAFADNGPTLDNPMDCSPPGFSVHGIFQARVQEWDAIAFSKHFC